MAGDMRPTDTTIKQHCTNSSDCNNGHLVARCYSVAS
jgi:hypothetical protein